MLEAQRRGDVDYSQTTCCRGPRGIFLNRKGFSFIAASCGVEDGLVHPMLARLAGLQPGQHAQASLLRLLHASDAPQQLTEFPGEFVTRAMLHRRGYGSCTRDPHEFRMRFGAEMMKLASCWQNFLRRPSKRNVAQNHPVVGGTGAAMLETVIDACWRGAILENECGLLRQLFLCVGAWRGKAD